MDRNWAANLRPYFLLPTLLLACTERGSLMTHEEFTRKSSILTEQKKTAPMGRSRDQDQSKDAVEQDQQNQGGNTSMNGQLGHRDEDVELKNADSDLSG